MVEEKKILSDSEISKLRGHLASSYSQSREVGIEIYRSLSDEEKIYFFNESNCGSYGRNKLEELLTTNQKFDEIWNDFEKLMPAKKIFDSRKRLAMAHESGGFEDSRPFQFFRKYATELAIGNFFAEKAFMVMAGRWDSLEEIQKRLEKLVKMAGKSKINLLEQWIKISQKDEDTSDAKTAIENRDKMKIFCKVFKVKIDLREIWLKRGDITRPAVSQSRMADLVSFSSGNSRQVLSKHFTKKEIQIALNESPRMLVRVSEPSFNACLKSIDDKRFYNWGNEGYSSKNFGELIAKMNPKFYPALFNKYLRGAKKCK